MADGVGRDVYDFSVSSNFEVAVHKIGVEQRPVIVIDNFMSDSFSLNHFAINQTSFEHYVEAGNYYPGVRAKTPNEYFPLIYNTLSKLLREVFDIPEQRKNNASCCFSLTTVPPDQLSALQRIPHFDSFDADHLAILHYLCDESYGGTAFYRHRSTGFESLDRERMKIYWPEVQSEFVKYGEPTAEYISGSTNMFEQTARFSAKQNRLLIYRGKMLHAGIIPSEKGLQQDPASGRLTINTFLSFPV